jgi:hypothetical protein
MKALYLSFSLALLLCGVIFGAASGCAVEFPDDLPYVCVEDGDCGGAPHVCAALPDGRKYCCKPETELCNRLDDDCNGMVDDLSTESCYEGPDGTLGKGICRAGKPSCSSAGTILCLGEVRPSNEVCNGKDDDCDGTVDEGFDFQTGRNNCGRCDRVCAATEDCTAGQCTPRRETACANGVDDEGDGSTDCEDTDCNSLQCGDGCTCLGGRKAESACGNGANDDGDNPPLIDCQDTDCESRECGTGCVCASGRRSEGDCTNSANDDAPEDTLTDCADPDCTEKFCGEGCVCRGGIKAEDLCDDGLDNDVDGLPGTPRTDCQDTDCNNKVCGVGCLCAGTARKEVACYDGLDNDGDSVPGTPRTDCQDTDCTNELCAATGGGAICRSSACAETNCADGQDNDRDNLTDCADTDCNGQTCRSNPNRTCSSGVCPP